MEILPNAAYGFHVLHSPTDPPPFRIVTPKGRTERATRPRGRSARHQRPPAESL